MKLAVFTIFSQHQFRLSPQNGLVASGEISLPTASNPQTIKQNPYRSYSAEQNEQLSNAPIAYYDEFNGRLLASKPLNSVVTPPVVVIPPVVVTLPVVVTPPAVITAPVSALDPGESKSRDFANAPNTDFENQYFKPMLPERTLGSYTNVVNTKAIWERLPKEEKIYTLYWESGCRFRMERFNDEVEQQKKIDAFEVEFNSKKEQCTLLIVHLVVPKVGSQAARDEWGIAGYNDGGLFKKRMQGLGSKVMKELMRRNVVDRRPLVALIAPMLGRTAVYDRLWGYYKSELTLFDDLGKDAFPSPIASEIKLTVTEPSHWSNVSAYPGCVGKVDMHYRLCGEFNQEVVLTGSEVHSQRWTRLNNLDVDNAPFYEKIKDKSKIIYDKHVVVSFKNILAVDIKKPVPIFFEISLSKVPGDFSNNACKPNYAQRYSSNLQIRLTQKGLTTYDKNLPDVCKIDSERLQHYYVNVRAVNIDRNNFEINESLCDGKPTGCKFHIYEYLDTPEKVGPKI